MADNGSYLRRQVNITNVPYAPRTWGLERIRSFAGRCFFVRQPTRILIFVPLRGLTRARSRQLFHCLRDHLTLSAQAVLQNTRPTQTWSAAKLGIG